MKTFKFKPREITTTLKLLREGSITPVSVMEEVVQRMMEADKEGMQYFVGGKQDYKGMLEGAFQADDRYKKGSNRPLEGLPVGLKDNID